MKKINVLTKNVYNRIAAGEVIERPYSAVKELIENSLDAKATEIEIHIEQGGKQLIEVVDNGTGIERDDLADAFTPHATSKIARAEDLENITTLGFRGEALASISVIAKVELISVTEGNSAYRITCEDGNTSKISPSALERGTVIRVRDLFYNTPARAKFLRSDKKEESDITNFVIRYILGNPTVAFKYYVDGNLTLQSFGGGLDEAIAQVYGAKVLSQCYKIVGAKDGFRVHGFIGNQNFYRPNKTYQSVFLNGRYIVNYTIATCLNNAYANYLMKRQYPFYVLNIEVPLDFVDVNVHPNKSDVRFVDPREIYGIVYHIISPVLDGTAKAAEFVISETRVPEIKSTSGAFEGNRVYSQNDRSVHSVQPPLPERNEPEDRITFEADDKLFDFSPPMERSMLVVTDSTVVPTLDNYEAYKIQKEYFDRKELEQQRIDYLSCKFKGNLFNTYLIYEKSDTVYLIDQHAAHERLLYDELIKKVRERKINIQPMLVPYIFYTNTLEAEFLDANIQVLRSMGIGIDHFGFGSYRVDQVPVDLQSIEMKDFFDEVLSNVNSLKNIEIEDILKEKFAMTACKHAIKGGMELTKEEVDTLFNLMEGNMGLKCPHGRPVCVTMTKKDIEKMFKRIV